jgi:hypothetical protein
MIIHEKVIQGSDAWFALRRGRPTASRFKDIITAQKGDLSKSSPAYIAELIGECFVPDWIDFAGNKFTDRGTELEPVARKAFEEHTGDKTTEVGFVTRADEVVGCSPDGLVLHLGKNLERDAVYDKHNRITNGSELFCWGVEIKCPSPKVHVGWIMAGGLPDEHKQQVHGSMAVTGLNSWHFFSFFPGLQPFHVIVHRDAYTAKLSASLDQFLIDYAAARSAVIPKLSLQ